MKKFQFKFETVLKVKEKKEEALKHELMKLQALKIEQEQLLSRIDDEKKGMAREKGAEKSRDKFLNAMNGRAGKLFKDALDFAGAQDYDKAIEGLNRLDNAAQRK